MSIGIKGASSVRRALGALLAFGAINAFAGGYCGLSGAKSRETPESAGRRRVGTHLKTSPLVLPGVRHVIAL